MNTFYQTYRSGQHIPKAHNCRKRLLCASAVLLLGVLSPLGEARGGGLRVKKWLDLPTLTNRSSVIVAGEVLSVDHVLHSRRAHGHKVTYLAVFRVHMKVENVLRGPKYLHRQKKRRSELRNRRVILKVSKK